MFSCLGSERYNKHLINLICLVRAVSHGSLRFFFLSIYEPCVNRLGKNSFRTLPHKPDNKKVYKTYILYRCVAHRKLSLMRCQLVTESFGMSGLFSRNLTAWESRRLPQLWLFYSTERVSTDFFWKPGKPYFRLVLYSSSEVRIQGAGKTPMWRVQKCLSEKLNWLNS